MNQKFEYDIFLSHNSKDKDWVRNLATKIESENYKERKLKVFFDEWDIKPGQNILERLEKGLIQSRFVGVILSKNSVNAEWPSMEWSVGVYSDPSGRKGTVIPIWLGNCDIPPSLKIRNVLYCRNDQEFKKSYSNLISILTDKEIPRGSNNEKNSKSVYYIEKFPIDYEDSIQEQLASNIFPVIKIPDSIWSGPTSFTNKEVFEYLLKHHKGIHPTYTVKEKRIFCFWDLNDKSCPFQEILNANSIEKIPTKSWLQNENYSKWLMELLNRGIRNYFWDLNLKFDPAHQRYYFPPLGGTNREISWDTGKRKATRRVTAFHKKGETDRVFWSHQSLRAKFLILDEEIFLQIMPGWTFTVDGNNPLPSSEIGPLSTKWTTNERNSSLFYHVRFWSNLISKSSNKIMIPLGNSYCEVDTTPAVIEINAGLQNDLNPIEKVFEIADDEIQSTEILQNALVEDEN